MTAGLIRKSTVNLFRENRIISGICLHSVY